MRRKEERSKQGQTNNKAKQHSTPNVHVHATMSNLQVMKGLNEDMELLIVKTNKERYDMYVQGTCISRVLMNSICKLYVHIYIYMYILFASVFVGVIYMYMYMLLIMLLLYIYIVYVCVWQ